MESFKLLGSVAVAAALLAGCAGRPIYDLSSESFRTVDRYATSVAEYLKGNSEDRTIAQAMRVVADSLKDPGSAQFRKVRLVPYSQRAVICGEVNGKNSYGGYAGFKRFVASTSEVTFSESGKYADIDEAANSGINAACGLG